MEITKTLYVSTRGAWRAWLKKNHSTASEIWLIYYRKKVPGHGEISKTFPAPISEYVLDGLMEQRDVRKFSNSASGIFFE